jgi:hypothetical protein
LVIGNSRGMIAHLGRPDASIVRPEDDGIMSPDIAENRALDALPPRAFND